MSGTRHCYMSLLTCCGTIKDQVFHDTATRHQLNQPTTTTTSTRKGEESNNANMKELREQTIFTWISSCESTGVWQPSRATDRRTRMRRNCWSVCCCWACRRRRRKNRSGRPRPNSRAEVGNEIRREARHRESRKVRWARGTPMTGRDRGVRKVGRCSSGTSRAALRDGSRIRRGVRQAPGAGGSPSRPTNEDLHAGRSND